MTPQSQSIQLLTILVLGVPVHAQEEPADQRGIATQLLQTADEIMGEVAELRGWPYKHAVDKGVHSDTELRAFLKKKLLEEELGGGRLEQHQWMLSDLGFLPKGTDLADTILDVLLSQVGGFYDPEQNSFFMMEQAANYGDFLNRTMIAHELTHALDDQYFDLDTLMKAREDEEDAGFAIGAVVEGSATALMTRWAAGHRDLMDPEEMKAMLQQQEEQNRILVEAPLYFATLVARYTVGMSFLLKGDSIASLMAMHDGVAENLRAVMKDVPVSSEQILHPNKYWDPRELDLPVRVVDEEALTTRLATELQADLVAKDTLGELLCAILSRNPDKKLNSQLMMAPSYWTSKGSRGWGGDRVYMFKRAKDRGIVWCTWWDSEKDCAEFRTAYRRYYEKRIQYRAATSGRLAVFTYGSARSHVDRILEICATAATTKGDQAFKLTDQD